MRAAQKTFAEEFERVLVESDTSVRRLARLSNISRRTLENWLYAYTARPRHIDQILKVARALKLPAMETDRLLLSAGHPTLNRLRQKKQLQPDILLKWQLPPDTQKGQKNSALHHAQQLLQQMPWNEEAHREVMELLALNGRRSEALKQYQICKQNLRDELGVEPSAETLALYERIRRTAHFSRDQIPAIVTPLIGRENELASLSRLLADPGVRLVTITGLGGMGKTRLALELAWKHTKGAYKDGVIFAKLAALESADLLVSALAEALHLPLKAADAGGARQQLLDYLKPKQILLVLDNCEHLLDGMTLVADILEVAPQVQIVTTSRERLRLRAEHVYPLHGLAHDEQINHPAALMFKGTVQRIKPDFEINEGNASSINHLCRLVDGMPLALELAAAWLDTATVEKLVSKVEAKLAVLTTDMRDMPQRHRSLSAVLHSTWERLGPRARRLFTSLSVFHGSFTAEAAQDVAEAAPDALSSLVEHSLLRFDTEEARYELHDMLRQFAAERLADDPDQQLTMHQRHFHYYYDLVQQGGQALRGGDQAAWMTRLEKETSNIRKAITWAIARDIETAANLAISLQPFWLESGRIQEAAQLYEQIMPLQYQLSPVLRPWLLTFYAEMILTQGATQESLALEWQALPLFWEQKDNAGAAYTYLLFSRTSRRISGDIALSIQLADTGLRLAQEPGTDPYFTSLLLESLSDSLLRSGNLEETAERIKQGLRLCEERNDQIMASYFRALMTGLLMMQGQYAEAGQLAEESLGLARQLGILYAELLALEALGLNAVAQGELELAKQYFADDHALCKERNYKPAQAVSALNMSDVLLAESVLAEALAFISEALFIFQEIGSQSGVAESIERLAQWAWQYNKSELHSVRWFACALAWREGSGEAPSQFDNERQAAVRAEFETYLDEAELSQIWSEGEAMSLEEALEEVLLFLVQLGQFS